MKNNMGIMVAAFGLLCSICSSTVFEDNQFLEYIFLGSGVLLAIYGIYKADIERARIG